jgi:hypothetical protein
LLIYNFVFRFIGLLVLYPSKFGVGFATDEDLASLVHLWAVIGHQLGMKDEYNWCLEGLDALRRRGADFVQTYILPQLKKVDSNWEHMSRVMAEGVGLYSLGVTFEVVLLYFLWVLDVPTDNLWKITSWSSRITFTLTRLLITVFAYFPGVKSFLQWLYVSNVSAAMKADKKWMENAQEKSILYQKNFL